MNIYPPDNSRHSIPGQQLGQLLSSDDSADVNDLSVEGQTLFNFMILLINIEYRRRHGKKLDNQYGRGYSVAMPPGLEDDDWVERSKGKE